MITIPRQSDVIFLYWKKNPLQPHSPKRIFKFTIIGEVKPCTHQIFNGAKLKPALKCLLDNGFKIQFEQSTGVNGYIVLERN
ncbi:hypothetical protein [Metabacillus fastidiosus]|nr:hypothetical protein [Metabacillus fastidiosus]MEC2075342.1 hypothetical protein [Metabacillus fastidiosus]